MEYSIRAHNTPQLRLAASRSTAGNVPEHWLNGKISRLSCRHPLAKKDRHHPLARFGQRLSRIRGGVKRRQKAATDLPQFDAF
jgi:hypothetical protein